MHRSERIPTSLFPASALLTRIVKRRQRVLLHSGNSLVRCGRAVSLDRAQADPIQDALRRNIEAALAGHPEPCW